MFPPATKYFLPCKKLILRIFFVISNLINIWASLFFSFLVFPTVFCRSPNFKLKIGHVPPVMEPIVAGDILLDTEFKVKIVHVSYSTISEQHFFLCRKIHTFWRINICYMEINKVSWTVWNLVNWRWVTLTSCLVRSWHSCVQSLSLRIYQGKNMGIFWVVTIPILVQLN